MNTTPTQQPAPDHCEPWQLTTDFAFDITIRGELAASFDKMKHANRAVSCVNACAGMADPAAEIQAMRTAIKDVYNSFADEPASDSVWLLNDRQTAALAKLLPFLKP